MSVDTILARNRAFSAAGGHETATMFPTLRLLVLTCLDPRVDPAQILRLDLGDAIVVRNGGGRVTPEVINNVALVGLLAANALPEGPLFEVAVIHHTECGLRALSDEGFRGRYADLIGVDEVTLRESAIVDPAATVVVLAGDRLLSLRSYVGGQAPLEELATEVLAALGQDGS